LSRSAWFVVGAFLALTVVVSAAAPASPQTCDRVASGTLVRIDGVRSDRGTLVVALYGDKPEEFLKKRGRLARERVSARAGSVAVCLEPPRPGTYAIAVYHDENDNGKFDRSWTGLPTEGFGVSNNPTPVLRAPTLSESAIQVGSGHKVVNIDLRY
jgi:uncharacterized protein (DUF2141 family)